MSDLVVTCPKGFWREWIAEGDAAGEPYTGEEWGWFMGGRRPPIEIGERLYVVAHGKLRGFAPVTAVHWHGAGVDSQGFPYSASGSICRRGEAVAVTLDVPIPGFRSWRRRWWPREAERPFPDWREP